MNSSNRAEQLRALRVGALGSAGSRAAALTALEEEDDLLRQQAEFVGQRGSRPAATARKGGSTTSGSTPSLSSQPTAGSLFKQQRRREQATRAAGHSDQHAAIPALSDRVLEHDTDEQSTETLCGRQAAPSTGFPALQRLRTQSAHAPDQLQRPKSLFARQHAPATTAIPPIGDVQQTSPSSVPIEALVSAGTPSALLAEVRAENELKLQEMSDAEIEQQRAELLRTLPPGVIAALTGKANKAALSANQPAPAAARPAPVAAPATGQPLTSPAAPSRKQASYWMSTIDPSAAPSVDIHDVHTSWDAADGTGWRSWRVDLQGALLDAASTQSPGQSLSVDLYHHGDEADRPGYTLGELCHLIRSNVAAQRIANLNVIANVLLRCGRNQYQHPAHHQDPQHLSASRTDTITHGVSELHRAVKQMNLAAAPATATTIANNALPNFNHLILDHLLHHALPALLRTAVDDSNVTVVIAGTRAIHALLNCEQHLSTAWDSINEPSVLTSTPLYRGYQPHHDHLSADIRLGEDDAADDTAERDAEVYKQDVVLGFMQMHAVERFRYLLDYTAQMFHMSVVQRQAVIQQIIEMLYVMSLHSVQAACLIHACPYMPETLISLLREMRTLPPSLQSTTLLQLIATLCQANRTAAVWYTKHEVVEIAQTFCLAANAETGLVDADASSDHNKLLQLSIAGLNLWRVLLSYGISQSITLDGLHSTAMRIVSMHPHDIHRAAPVTMLQLLLAQQAAMLLYCLEAVLWTYHKQADVQQGMDMIDRQVRFADEARDPNTRSPPPSSLWSQLLACVDAALKHLPTTLASLNNTPSSNIQLPYAASLHMIATYQQILPTQSTYEPELSAMQADKFVRLVLLPYLQSLYYQRTLQSYSSNEPDKAMSSTHPALPQPVSSATSVAPQSSNVLFGVLRWAYALDHMPDAVSERVRGLSKHARLVAQHWLPLLTQVTLSNKVSAVDAHIAYLLIQHIQHADASAEATALLRRPAARSVYLLAYHRLYSLAIDLMRQSVFPGSQSATDGIKCDGCQVAAEHLELAEAIKVARQLYVGLMCDQPSFEQSNSLIQHRTLALRGLDLPTSASPLLPATGNLPADLRAATWILLPFKHSTYLPPQPTAEEKQVLTCIMLQTIITLSRSVNGQDAILHSTTDTVMMLRAVMELLVSTNSETVFHPPVYAALQHLVHTILQRLNDCRTSYDTDLDSPAMDQVWANATTQLITTLVETAAGEGYGDIIYTQLLLYCCQQQYPVAWRTSIWRAIAGEGELVTASHAANDGAAASYAVDLQHYLQPVETDATLLSLYKQALSSDRLRDHTSPFYLIATHHIATTILGAPATGASLTDRIDRVSRAMPGNASHETIAAVAQYKQPV